MLWVFYTLLAKNMKNEPKKPIFLRYELFKMYNGGYTQEQMQDFVKNLLEGWNITQEQIIDALVTSRFEELTLKKRLDGVMDALKWY